MPWIVYDFKRDFWDGNIPAPLKPERVEPVPQVERSTAHEHVRDSHSLNSDSELDTVVWRVHEILLRTQVPFRRLNGGMPQQQLNLLQFAASRTAHLRT